MRETGFSVAKTNFAGGVPVYSVALGVSPTLPSRYLIPQDSALSIPNVTGALHMGHALNGAGPLTPSDVWAKIPVSASR